MIKSYILLVWLCITIYAKKHLGDGGHHNGNHHHNHDDHDHNHGDDGHNHGHHGDDDHAHHHNRVENRERGIFNK